MTAPGIQREITFGEPIVDQARRIVEAQLAAAPPPYVSPVPAGTSLRALFLGERGDAIVDLSGEVRGKADRSVGRHARSDIRSRWCGRGSGSAGGWDRNRRRGCWSGRRGGRSGSRWSR